jgi:uncharacterized protein YcbK (DUF882 family)
VGDLSEHFSRWEFADRRAPSRSNARRAPIVDPSLVAVLERLRAIDDRPLPIVSGFRTAATNRLVGGAPNSQHLFGRAADIPQGRFTVAQARRAGARGIGHCDGWVVHVDVRRSAAVVIFRDC